MQPVVNVVTANVVSKLTAPINNAVTSAAVKVSSAPGEAEAGAVVTALGQDVNSILSGFTITL